VFSCGIFESFPISAVVDSAIAGTRGLRFVSCQIRPSKAGKGTFTHSGGMAAVGTIRVAMCVWRC